MCGRYTAVKSFELMVKRAGAFLRGVPYVPRYNIAPTQLAPVIVLEEGQPTVKLMRWGLIPSWAKEDSTGGALINARVESLATRATFREAFKRRRCLVPADGFYEWKEREGKRQPFRVVFRSGEPFCFAGLWERWVRPVAAENALTDLQGDVIDSFTIITRAANATLAPLHDRMPVILHPEHFGDWLADGDPPGDRQNLALEHPLQEPIKIYPVSNLVNSVKTNDPRCIEPVRIERDMFEAQWWAEG
jgi:putative SOS response-associated peptidase YedK